MKTQAIVTPETLPRIILASTSQYKRRLLSTIITRFEAKAPNVEEMAKTGETASEMAIRLATEKATSIAKQYPTDIIIGADQVCAVTIDNNQVAILGKPGTKKNAINQLTQCNGKTVGFYTAVTVLSPRTTRPLTYCERTKVRFRALTDTQIKRYVDIEEPLDCAGSFKCEGLGIRLFKHIESRDPQALIGLPLIGLVDLLEQIEVEPLDYHD